MLFANWIDVPDAMAFLDAFAEAAGKTRGWKLDSIKTDYGHQFVYVRYAGRKFAGKGLMASAFAPVPPYRERAANFSSRGCTHSIDPSSLDEKPRKGRRFVAGGASPRSDAPKYTEPHRGERTQPRSSHRPIPHETELRHSPFAIPAQRVNLTLRADEWPTHLCFDQSARQLLAPLLKKARQSSTTLKLLIS